MSAPVTLTREELYRRVWEKPMIHCASDLGITGNGLARICDRLSVPYPPRGHWAKLQAGKPSPRTPLSEALKNTQRQVRISPTEPKSEKPTDPVEAELSKAIPETTPTVRVNERLTNPHPFVRGWMDEEQQNRKRYRGDPWMRDLVKPETELDRLKRRVQDALFKALEARGYKLERENAYSQVVIATASGQRVEVSVSEWIRQYRRALTPAEIKERGYGGKFTQVREPTGRLHITAKGGYGHKATWPKQDGPPVEEMMGLVVLGVEAIAKAAAASDEARRKQEEEWRRAHQEREHRIYLRQQDENRWQAVRKMAAHWAEAERLRGFVEAVELTAAPNDEAVEQWLQWAKAHLESFHPLRDGAAGVTRRTASVTGHPRDTAS